ncbi:MAG: Ig domain-containing protein [Ardenticatenaceae bacterium]|nr:Ig domain-containing protein [Ardenticatenaceae bacterium]
MENPELLGKATPDDILLERLRVMNDEIYLRQARIQFISGARTGGFPRIEGPRLDGHILNPLLDVRELHRSFNRCRLAWRDKDPAVTGLIALNINRFVDAGGIPTTSVLGFAGWITRDSDLDDIGQQMIHGVASVVDRAHLVENPDDSLPRPLPLGPDPNEKWVAHEFGHALSLARTPNAHVTDGRNLMDDHSARAVELNPDQVERLRAQTALIPDRKVVASVPPPPGRIFLASTLADELGDAATSAPSIATIAEDEMFVDIDTVGVGIDENTGMTHLVVSTFGLLPENISGMSYFFASDLDNDPTSGGAPADLGFPLSTTGVELLGRIQLDVNGGMEQGTPTVWQFQNGQFLQVMDSRIQARIGSFDAVLAPSNQTDEDHNIIPLGQIIQLVIPNTVRGPIAADFRLAVGAENPSTGSADSVEGSLTLDSPVFPSCQVSPSAVLLGSRGTVSATGLPANSPVEVFLGSKRVGTGSTDSGGDALIEITVPVETQTGSRSISVQVVGTAVSASCETRLTAIPAFDVPPSPSSGSEFVVNVGETLTFTIQASDADVEDVVSLGVIGLPSGASFAIPPPGNPISSTLSWTPTSDQVGSYVIVFTGSDNGGLSAPPHSVVVTVQRATEVDIDIKPGSDTNPINPRSKDAIPVAIFTTPEFDATTVDPLSVRFGPAVAAEIHNRGHIEDVDLDGDLDMMLHFAARQTGIAVGDPQACLTGETVFAQKIQGCDTIRTVPPLGSGTVRGTTSGTMTTFDFSIQRNALEGTVSGALEYRDESARLLVRTSTINSFTMSGNTATFSGSATINDSNSVSFTVTVQDNGESDSGSDTFSINLSTGYSNSGVLASGDIILQSFVYLPLIMP